MKLYRLTPARRPQRGAVAIVVALSLAVLIGFAGLALDTGRLYLTKTELQNAADACALAAAYELTGAPAIAAASFTIAENAAVLLATRNRVGFQGSAIDAQDVTVQFGTTLGGGAWLSAAANPPGDSRYVRCTIQESGIAPWFMQVLGVGPQSVAALATATLQPAQTNCSSIPLAMCAQGPAPTYGLVPGQWYDGGFSNENNLTGSFNWVDFSPPAGGASELAAILQGNGACLAAVSTPVGAPGNIGSISREWNSRFGLYQNPTINVANAPPDRTGYSYTVANWPSRANALADFLARRSAHDNYGITVAAGNALTGLSLQNSYNPTTTTAQHTAFGADRRLVSVPLLDCSGLTGSQTVPILDWACVLMLHPIDNNPALTIYMEFEALAGDPTSPCASSGVPGGTTSLGPQVPGLVQ